MNNYMSDFKQNMVIKNFSLSTQKSYSYMLRLFLEHCEIQKNKINSKSFKEYLCLLKEKNKLSSASLKQKIGAIKFFLSTPLTYLTN